MSFRPQAISCCTDAFAAINFRRDPLIFCSVKQNSSTIISVG